MSPDGTAVDRAAIALALRTAYRAHLDGDNDKVCSSMDELQRIGTPAAHDARRSFLEWRTEDLEQRDVERFLSAHFTIDRTPPPEASDEEIQIAERLAALLTEHTEATADLGAAAMADDRDAVVDARARLARLELEAETLRRRR